MPILWQPGVPTNLTASPAAYTLVIIATQDIDVGVILRFTMWDGLNYTYDAPAGGTMVTFDLVVQQAIPASTQVTVSMRASGTCLFALDGIAQYSNVGAGVALSYNNPYASMICRAYVPTASGSGYAPASGQPQFAIGFSYIPDQQGPAPACEFGGLPLVPGGASATAPNFPDQFSAATNPWTFEYEVVYPAIVKYAGTTCYRINGIKFKDEQTFANGSWTNLRQVIAQPQTVIQNSYETINNWEPYSTLGGTQPPDNSATAVMGPFVYAVAEGQLAVVYFRPLPGAYPLLNTAQAKPPAEVAFVLTAPIPANVPVFVTIQGYDATNLGYGPRSLGGTAFIYTNPSFTWTTGASALAAGTVVIITNIGAASAPGVEDAHTPAHDVGTITGWTSASLPVVSLIFVGGAWAVGTPQRFITAALSSQYVGDFPQLSPSLTVHPTPFTYPSIYGQGKTFTNLGLPGTVQAAMVNSGAFVTLPWGTPVLPTTLPTFLNMATFSF